MNNCVIRFETALLHLLCCFNCDTKYKSMRKNGSTGSLDFNLL